VKNFTLSALKRESAAFFQRREQWFVAALNRLKSGHLDACPHLAFSSHNHPTLVHQFKTTPQKQANIHWHNE